MLWGPFQDCCCQLPNCLASLLTHTSMRGPPILEGSLVQSSMGSLLFSPGCWCMWDFVCALQGQSLFLPVPLLDPQAGKPDMGLRTSPVGELLSCYYSPICGSPTWQVWDFILLWLCPSYHLVMASSLSLDIGYLFLVGSSVLMSMIVQQMVAILVLSQEEISTHSSTLPSWTGNPVFLLLNLSLLSRKKKYKGVDKDEMKISTKGEIKRRIFKK